MKIISDIREWQNLRKNFHSHSVGFIPTMGNLHLGHLSLCQHSKQDNDITIASIFVNPTQFNWQDDFNHYPRTLENDKKMLEENNVDFLLIPEVDAIYVDEYQVQVTETDCSKELEGQYRPGHFNGMLTVVLKLLNLVQPTRAYFGEKDYQQLLLVRKMVQALFLPTEIIGCSTIRAEDGLALSSRNSRLSPEQRIRAANFPAALMSSLSVEKITEKLEALNFKVDYIAEKWGRRLGAVWLDDVRLIDNVEQV